MQKAPVMKGSGLEPINEGKSGDKPAHVFGSNLESRVVTDNDAEESPAISFGNLDDPKKEDDIETIRKRKFDAITGEEDEETVFQSDFKLFAWDLPSSNWAEKGRGQLKLNDSLDEGKKKSRIIMRVGGTLKIVLNVAIRHSTFRIIAGSKTSIRFTDSQTVWAASGSNAEQLKDLINERLEIDELEAEASKKKPKTDSGEKSEEGGKGETERDSGDGHTESEKDVEENDEKNNTAEDQNGHRSE